MSDIAIATLTKEQFIRVLPKQVKTRVTDELVANINSLMGDQQLRENFRDNLLSYTGVMADGKYKIGDYVNAVRYVSFKLLGASNIEAYTKTFPDRYQRLLDEQAEDKTIASYSTAYNKTQLVNKIMEQTLIPVHILNADLYQKALNRQAFLMTNANSEKVQSDAANSLLTHLKTPETQKIELDVSVKEDKSINELREATLALAKRQRQMIEAGAMTPKDVAHSEVIVGESELVSENE